MMDDEVARTVARWRAAEEGDRDDEADAAFKALFDTVAQQQPVPAQFAARTMAMIAAAQAADRRRARLGRRALVWGGASGAAAAAYLGSGWALSAASNFLAFGLDLFVAGIVWLASGADARAGFWSVLTNIGRGVAAFAGDPQVTFVLVALQALAIAGLVALHRLLGSDTEFSE